MMNWKRWQMYLAIAVPLASLCLAGGNYVGDQSQSEEVTIYRDEFGIPNIFAETAEGAVYGMGYAQAEDRLEEILKQYRRAEGTMAEAFGSQFVRDDYRQRLWQHRAPAVAAHQSDECPVPGGQPERHGRPQPG